MATTDTPPHPHRPGVLPSDMGEMRTIMAADRTLMAWIRTALSMLSFGFTIHTFLQTIAAQGPMEHPNSPQQVGLFLTAMGVAALVLGTSGYWVTLRDLERIEKFRLGRPVLLMALIMSLAGVALFVSIATRII
jgi:putative membrane protein